MSKKTDFNKNQKFFSFREEASKKLYKNYRVGLIASVLHAYFVLNQAPKLDYLFSSLKKIITTPILSKFNNCNETALFYSIPREDYREIMDFVVGEFNLNGIALDEPCLLSLNVRRSSFKELTSFLLPASKLARDHSGNFLDKIFYFSIYFYLLKGFSELENSNIKNLNNAVFFNSSNFPESMLCEFFRSKGVNTFSMQHGMYLYPELIYFDVVNFSNVMAETLLCWGDASKQAVEQFYEKNNLPMNFCCKIAGYPRNTSAMAESKTISEKVLVLLPRYIYKKESINLLEILKKIRNIDFIIKPHPSLVKDPEITAICDEMATPIVACKLSTCLNNTQFRAVIGFNSTSIFESIPNTSAILLYSSGQDEFSAREFEYFSTTEELSKLLLSNNHSSSQNSTLTYESYFGEKKRRYFQLINQ